MNLCMNEFEYEANQNKHIYPHNKASGFVSTSRLEVYQFQWQKVIKVIKVIALHVQMLLENQQLKKNQSTYERDGKFLFDDEELKKI
ncbi:virion structural protein [Staphylococcus phage S-CoN_Ph17]|nr:virion structural protein [Staphylococcus phage S-CoN_Ph17]